MRGVVTSTGSCTEHVQPRFPTRLPHPRLHADAAIERPVLAALRDQGATQALDCGISQLDQSFDVPS